MGGVIFIVNISRVHGERYGLVIVVGDEVRHVDPFARLGRRTVHLDPAVEAARDAERHAFAEYPGMHIARNGQRMLIN